MAWRQLKMTHCELLVISSMHTGHSRTVPSSSSGGDATGSGRLSRRAPSVANHIMLEGASSEQKGHFGEMVDEHIRSRDWQQRLLYRTNNSKCSKEDIEEVGACLGERTLSPAPLLYPERCRLCNRRPCPACSIHIPRTLDPENFPFGKKAPRQETLRKTLIARVIESFLRRLLCAAHL